MTVMICGSRAVTKLPPRAIAALDKIIQRHLPVVIGDAPGADTLCQTYFHQRGYRNVIVYVATFKYEIRNNLGEWPVFWVGGNYSDRDQVMCNDSKWMLAIWDGISPGTKANIGKFMPSNRRVVYCGINIWSGSPGLGGALTNPTEIARRKGSIGMSYPVKDTNGKVWPDAESAYKSLKRGETKFDCELMVKIIAAKLKQYPFLRQAIAHRGGVEWLEQCSHHVNGKSRWEGDGRNSNFIRCLIAGYEMALR